MIEAIVNGKKHIALVDSGCSQTLMTRSVCNPLSRQKLDIQTVNSDGVSTIMLAVDNVRSMKADVLVIDSPLLGFDMLLEMDIIRMLGGVRINHSGDITFSRTEPCICIMIRIEEPDFSAKFDKQNRAWTASWKWSDNQPHNELMHKVPESPMSTQVRQEYCH